MMPALRGLGGDCEKSMTVRTARTVEGQLREEKESLEKRINDVNAVLEALKNAPEVSNVLEALNKLGY